LKQIPVAAVEKTASEEAALVPESDAAEQVQTAPGN
jgi:hypothetical protein